MSRSCSPICRALLAAASALLLCLAPAAIAQPQLVTQNSEARAARAFEQARRQGPLALYAFLHDMPKGADLHTHLAGAVYAESFIRQAVEDNLCVNSKSITLYKTTATTRSLPPQPVCGEEGQRVSDALINQKLYDQLIDTFPCERSFPPPGSRGTTTFSHPSITFWRSKIPGMWASGWMSWRVERPRKTSSTLKL